MAGRPQDERGAGERASFQGVPGTGYHEKEAGGRALGLMGMMVTQSLRPYKFRWGS